MLRTRAHRRYAAALPLALEQIAAHLRGGGTVGHGVAALAGGDGPLAGDLRRVQARADLGVGLADALAAWPVERGVGDVRAVAGALAVAETLGGRSAHALDGLAASLRDRIGAAAEARSLSAQARLSAVVVGASPLAYLVFSALVDPGSVGAAGRDGHWPRLPRGRSAARGGRCALDAAHPRVGGGTVSASPGTVVLWLVGLAWGALAAAPLAVRARRQRVDLRLRPLRPTS